MPWVIDLEDRRVYVRRADYERYGEQLERMIREARAKAAAEKKIGAAEKATAKGDAAEADPVTARHDIDLDHEYAWIADAVALLRQEHPHLAHLLDGPPPRPRCGARTRGPGNPPCRAPAVEYGKRCRLHGGLSSGAITEEGKARVDEARRKRWEAYHAAKSMKSASDSTSR